MAASINKVILLGNLTRDPEIRHTAGDQSVANFGLAMNRRFRTKEGEQREEVTFVDCEAWGRLAELMGQYFNKGRAIMVEGRLKLDQWTDQNGQNRSKLRVVAENLHFVDSRSDGGGGGGGGRSGGSDSEQRQQGQPVGAASGASGGNSGGSSGGNGSPTITDDDIPF